MDAITVETVRVWAKELARLVDEDAERARKKAELTRKIEAAAVLGLRLEDEHVTDTASELDTEAHRDGKSVPVEILAAMRRMGKSSRRPSDIRKELLRMGVPASRLGRNGAYLYSCVGRLAERGLIRKKGKGYVVSET